MLLPLLVCIWIRIQSMCANVSHSTVGTILLLDGERTKSTAMKLVERAYNLWMWSRAEQTRVVCAAGKWKMEWNTDDGENGKMWISGENGMDWKVRAGNLISTDWKDMLTRNKNEILWINELTNTCLELYNLDLLCWLERCCLYYFDYVYVLSTKKVRSFARKGNFCA